MNNNTVDRAGNGLALRATVAAGLSAISGAVVVLAYAGADVVDSKLTILPIIFGFFAFRGFLGRLVGIAFCIVVAVISAVITLQLLFAM